MNEIELLNALIFIMWLHELRSQTFSLCSATGLRAMFADLWSVLSHLASTTLSQRYILN